MEFAVVAPTFLLCIFAVFGVGLNAFYQQFLDDAVRDAARQVQMAGPPSASASGFVNAVCAEFGLLASNCTTTLSYAVQSGGTNGLFASLTPETLNGSGQFSNSFFSGSGLAPEAPVLVQVAYPLPFTLPFIGTLLTGTNTGSIVSAASVLVEPYQ